MPKFTLDNSFRFYSQKETTPNFQSESIERLLKKLHESEGQIQADLMGWKKMLVKINDVLDDAMKKQATNQSVNTWLAKLQHLTYDAEDLLDEFQTETFRRMLMPGESTSQASTSHQLDFMAMSRVNEVNTRLQHIASHIFVLGLKSRNVRRRLVPTSLLILASRSGRRNPGPTIFSPLINEANLAFLKEEDILDFLERIGSGRLGEVYKAELPGSNGKMIAIKKIVQPPKHAAELIEEDDKLLNRRMRQIRSEITTAGRIRHCNILHLLAHMARPDGHLLVYEFMKNKSLLDILNDVSQGRRELDWLVRLRIALGVASGLEYLHISHSPTMIHRNIKPANVLLDDDMTAKITGFGVARPLPDNETHIETSNVVGTVGYIAPEYIQKLIVTCKCDIYSFGVLLAVLVIGKQPHDEFFLDTEEKDLVKWMRNVMTSGNPSRAVDSRLLGNGYETQMLVVLKIAWLCTLNNPEERPNSKYVRCMLSHILCGCVKEQALLEKQAILRDIVCQEGGFLTENLRVKNRRVTNS